MTIEGDDVIINCTANGVPDPLYSIFNSTSTLTVMQSNDAGVIRLENVTNALDDVYRCEATNSEGKGKTVYRELTIFGKFNLVWKNYFQKMVLKRI